MQVEQLETGGLSDLRAGRLDLIERTADTLGHAIKNPLHAMVINLEVLRRRVLRSAGADSAELLRYVEVLGDELQRVNHRVEMLLCLARAGGDGAETTLAELLEGAADLFRLEAESSRVRWQLGVDPRLARVRVSTESSRQLLLPLILDAISAAAQGGGVEVVAGFASGDARVTIRASDGSGAPLSLVDDDLNPRGSERIARARSIAERCGGSVAAVEAGLVLELPSIS